MEETKIIIFEMYNGWKDIYKEEHEFDIDTPVEVIQEAFEDFVWERVGDKVRWYEEGEE